MASLGLPSSGDDVLKSQNQTRSRGLRAHAYTAPLRVASLRNETPESGRHLRGVAIIEPERAKLLQFLF